MGSVYVKVFATDVLREFGKPEAVAERYRPAAQYLIGLRLFPAYVSVAKITWFLFFAVVEALVRLYRIFRRYPVW